jgi:hypothetical protein
MKYNYIYLKYISHFRFSSTFAVPKASFALLNMDDDVDEDVAESPSLSDDESSKKESAKLNKPTKQQKPQPQESQKESKKSKKGIFYHYFRICAVIVIR